MYKLSKEKQDLVLSQLVEGSSLRSIERITGTSLSVIIKILRHYGEAAQEQLDNCILNLAPRYVEADEIWSFVYKKQKALTPEEREDHEKGDQYTFLAMDAETKLLASYVVGRRNKRNAEAFLRDLKGRVQSRFQLTTDSYSIYTDTVFPIFGNSISYAQIHKEYEQEVTGTRRYSPPKVTAIRIVPMIGNPDPDHISTSYIERQNLTIRMQMRRFTRLTNAFSKTLENLKAAVSLHIWHYNFCRVHSTLRYTPAMASRLTDSIWGWDRLKGY
jgi:IS1 family transposase